MHETKQKFSALSMEKLKEKRLLERNGYIWEDNIEMHLTVVRCECVE